ncbi:MAG TPA: hypothetical protein VHN15_11055 [Thermoanaerobaculia bacterium]|nr:hypothetical protein [Thermoanaerobaculia bacterium]
MGRSFATSFAAILCTALLAAGLPGRAWAAEDICANPQGTLSSFLQEFSLSLQQQEVTEIAAARPSSDGFSEGGRLDLLRRAFVGLGLGQVTDGEGQLVFNFNPDALRLNSVGQLSPRIIVHQAKLDGALNEHIDTLAEGLRTAARDDLNEKLGDLDDIEYTLRWTPKAFEPAEDLQDMAGKLLDEVVEKNVSGIADKISQQKAVIAGALNVDDFFVDVPMADICGNDTAKAALEQVAQDLRTDIQLANAQLEKDLGTNGFTRLADLIEGNPRLVFSGSYRERSSAAGPDTRSAELQYQWGQVSYRGAKRFARKESNDENAVIDKATLDKYFEKHGPLEGAAPLFSLVASYAETDSFLVPIAGADTPFSLDAGHKLSIKGTAASYFGGGRDRKLELTAGYDDASNDDSLHDRFVANLTWVETLNSTLAAVAGGSELVVTLVWANKPEFRGEVDEDFGLRAGLKWSLGESKQK